MKYKKKQYWVESSYDFEDTEKKYEEQLVVAVTFGDTRETKTIAHFNDMSDRASLETLVKSFNDNFTF